MHTGVVYALLSAVLFGASTPFAKLLANQVTPATLAGLLYLGSGIGLLMCYIVRALLTRHARQQPAALSRRDLPWFAAAVAAGGVAGPLLLIAGLSTVSASSASLLLNMEGVLTSMLAWFVFKENFDRRIFIGMLLIVTAGVLLSWEQAPATGLPWGAIAIVGACLCWGIDNNLTRKVSAGDPLQIACIKGLVAGSVNLALGLAWGMDGMLPAVHTVLLAGVVGLCGYGLSLVLFVLALRHLGTARTGAYFSAAPFAGAALSLLMPGEAPGAMFWIALALMSGGIWLHLTEAHVHEHEHLPLSHAHMHRHDEYHQHEHSFPWNSDEPHTHPHQHGVLRHSHPHYPDIHHRHQH